MILFRKQISIASSSSDKPVLDMSLRESLQNLVPSISFTSTPAAVSSGDSQEGKVTENSQPSSLETSLVDSKIAEGESKSSFSVDAISEYLGQEGLVRTGREQNDRDVLDQPDQSAVSGNEDHSLYSSSLLELYNEFKGDEDPLRSTKRLERIIKACEFPAGDLLDIKERLRMLSDDGFYEDKELPARDESYAECRALILDQLQERLKKSVEDGLEPSRNSMLRGNLHKFRDTGRLNGYEEVNMSAVRDDSHGIETDEIGSDEVGRLQGILRNTESTTHFHDDESVEQLLGYCRFPQAYALRIHILRVRMFKPDLGRSRDYDGWTITTRSRDSVHAEFREMVIRQLRDRISGLIKVRNGELDADTSSAEPKRSTALYRRLGDATSIARHFSDGKIHVIGDTRAKGISIVNKVWGKYSDSYEAPLQDMKYNESDSDNEEPPLIMPLDGPVRYIYTQTECLLLMTMIGRYLYAIAGRRRTEAYGTGTTRHEYGYVTPQQGNLGAQASERRRQTVLRRSPTLAPSTAATNVQTRFCISSQMPPPKFNGHASKPMPRRISAQRLEENGSPCHGSPDIRLPDQRSSNPTSMSIYHRYRLIPSTGMALRIGGFRTGGRLSRLPQD